MTCKKGMEEALFKGFKVSNSLSYLVLHFADGMILLCDGGKENL